MTMKSATRSNAKKTNLKLQDLKANKDPQGGGGTPSTTKPSHGVRPDGRTFNHNEMFLQDLLGAP